jgi:RNA polymerase sigma-54 factor
MPQIVPDFIVECFDENLTFSLNNQNTPRLRVSNEFMQMLNEQAASSHADSRNAAQFLRQKIDNARDFILAIEQREQTLMRTMEAIISLQRPFFLEGDEALLRPLILKDVADVAGYDISTISRATNGKYVQTPFGLFPLRYFFSDGIANTEGEEVSVREIHNIIKELVDGEDKKTPLTDEQIVEALKTRGYKVARRTVAKYREQLHIPIARMRR